MTRTLLDEDLSGELLTAGVVGSTRWNPAIYASAGFVVVMPNPTGSTGYGQALTDAIACNWGGRPYEDLEKCFEYIVANMPHVDTDRAVALGASYGGYMINWIQGHPLGRRFKALVYHDGIFSTMNDWATEELFFVLHDMGGPLWEKRDVYEKWDPSRFTQNCKCPEWILSPCRRTPPRGRSWIRADARQGPHRSS